jgi:outer membrane lipoprotein LolB
VSGCPRRRPSAAAVGLRRLAAVAVLAVASCATGPVAPPDRSFAGRFSALATQGERRESVSGRFVVEVRGPRRTVDLATPLGTTVARIEVGPDGARASGPGVTEVRGNDADQLAEQLLGWRLPVTGLADWIEGHPVAGRAARVEHDGAQATIIEQDGWTIRYPERFAGGTPRSIVMERPAAPLAPGVVLRLVLDDPAG